MDKNKYPSVVYDEQEGFLHSAYDQKSIKLGMNIKIIGSLPRNIRVG